MATNKEELIHAELAELAKLREQLRLLAFGEDDKEEVNVEAKPMKKRKSRIECTGNCEYMIKGIKKCDKACEERMWEKRTRYFCSHHFAYMRRKASLEKHGF